jgi:Flp pilus assembly pilin Flp
MLMKSDIENQELELKQAELVDAQDNAARDEQSKDEQGATMVEYALLLTLIAVVAIIAIRIVGDRVSRTFSFVADEIEGAYVAGGN